MDKKYILLAVAVIAIVVVIGVYASGYGQTQTLKIATTTSLEDTGLLAVLETEYEKKYPNTDVQFIAAGTGQALEYGKKGDVDLVMVHAKTSEEKFIAGGFGTNRTIFAYNYFYIVGPATDPANINGSNSTSAFTKIGTDGAANPTEVMFVSRGDNSGTHTRELQIWNKTDLNYTTEVQGQPWYIESGKGMGDTLILANEKSAYTLSDSGTYLAFKGNLTLTALVTQGKDLLNVYSLIPVNPAKFPDVNSEDAQTWIVFVTSAEGQKIIGEYGVDKYGQQLFIPIAGQPEPT
ncbi:MAG: tungsten ABC transporter substrate-binding protein [Methanobacteriales archaeon Met13]